jgi:peptide deformylase
MAAAVDPRDIRTYDLQQFIDNLIETMLAEPGIGLAAPQVSRSIQLVVMGCEGEDGFPQTVLINPNQHG